MCWVCDTFIEKVNSASLFAKNATMWSFLDEQNRSRSRDRWDDGGETPSPSNDDDDDPSIAALSALGFDFRLAPRDVAPSSSAPFDRATRLFSVGSNVSVSSENRPASLPHRGPVFEAVAEAAQAVAVRRLVRDFGAKVVALPTVADDDDDEEEKAVTVLVDATLDPGEVEGTFVFVTGKGLSRAGVLSVTSLLEDGLEKGSVLWFLLEARRRKWRSVFLDPNQRGVRAGYDVVERSLDLLFATGDDVLAARPLFVLAHSAGGGHVVRCCAARRPDLVPDALCLTDSAHRFAWARPNGALVELLESPSRCLYVRNDALGDDPFFPSEEKRRRRAPGVPATTDEWWERRFGGTRTVWGGTVDHSRLCWTARRVVWDFFDEAARDLYARARNPEGVVTTDSATLVARDRGAKGASDAHAA